MEQFGLALIILSWLIQYFHSKKTIEPLFVAVYSLGVFLLVLGGYQERELELALLNLLALAVALLVLFKVRKK